MSETNEMVERVARKIYHRGHNAPWAKQLWVPWDDLIYEAKRHFRSLGRDAIRAMREPTEEMLQAAITAPRDMVMRDSVSAQAKADYAAQHRAAIDAILKAKAA
jgi:hypothetical protein